MISDSDKAQAEQAADEVGLPQEEAPAVAPKPVSDTPRTDKESQLANFSLPNDQGGTSVINTEVVPAGLCRQLEREVAELNRRLASGKAKRMIQYVESICAECGNIKGIDDTTCLRCDLTAAKAEVAHWKQEAERMDLEHRGVMQAQNSALKDAWDERDAAKAEVGRLTLERDNYHSVAQSWCKQAREDAAQVSALRTVLESLQSYVCSGGHSAEEHREMMDEVNAALAGNAPPVVPLSTAEKLAQALEQALRQWDHYASDQEEDLDTAQHTEAQWYREYVKLAKDFRQQHPSPQGQTTGE